MKGNSIILEDTPGCIKASISIRSLVKDKVWVAEGLLSEHQDLESKDLIVHFDHVSRAVVTSHITAALNLAESEAPTAFKNHVEATKKESSQQEDSSQVIKIEMPSEDGEVLPTLPEDGSEDGSEDGDFH